jgi:hypothetical protein
VVFGTANVLTAVVPSHAGMVLMTTSAWAVPARAATAAAANSETRILGVPIRLWLQSVT